MNQRHKNGYYLLYSGLFFYLFFLQLYYAWHFTIDDAFISFRYAKNLASDHGLSWNVGEAKVEGYSNFTYVLLQALLIKAKLPLLSAVKLFSCLSILLSTYGLYLVSRQLTLKKTLALLPSLLLLMHPGEILWGVSGLETPFYQALIIFSTLFILKGHADASLNKLALLLSGLLLALAGLTRPEAPLLLVSFITIQLVMLYKAPSRNEKIALCKKILFFIIGFTIVYGPYFLWRYHYFGHLFPNTVYCKFNNAPSGPFELDINYLILITPLLIISLPYLWLKKESNSAFLLLPSLAYLIALANADWIVGFWDRHFLAVFALLLPLCICGINTLLKHPKLQLDKEKSHLLTVLFSLLCGFLFISKGYDLTDYRQIAHDTQNGNALRTEVAHWLNERAADSEKVSLGDCGLIPYISKHTIIDSYCLNNASFSQSPINYSYERFANHLLTQIKPGYIILISLMSKKHIIYPPADLFLLKHKHFKTDYHSVQVAITLKNGKNYFLAYRYEIFQRNKLPHVTH